jgi:uncharacterized membrane protein YphA (DoxX/SURF4 family)
VIVSLHLRNIPTRAAAGSYILHSGLEKWNGSEEQAKGLHAVASGAYPVLGKVPPPTFLKVLSAAEIGTGALLLLPVVSNKLAGTVLTAFAGSLAGMYLRTPAMRQPGSVWPSQSGTAVSKDIWMVGIGLGLLADDATDSARKPTETSAA